jgi:hypothetical protein
LLTRYNDQLHSVEQIVEEQPLGILNICLNRFKEAVLPSPAELLSVVEHALPRYAPRIALFFSLISEVVLGVTTIFVFILCICMSFSGIYYMLQQ